MRLAIRVDASAQIGIGHVKRCLALASAWRADSLGEILFVTRVGDGARLIGEAGHDYALLAAAKAEGADQVVDAEQTLAALGEWHPAVVLVDHYGLAARWHEAVQQGIGARLAAIDDLADRPMAVDVLVDHNLAGDHRAKYGRRLPASARLLGGTRFALIDPLYASAPKAAPRDMVQSIGIFMGGADAAGATPRVLEACREHAGFVGPIEVVTTSANPTLAALRAMCSRWQQTTLSLDLDQLAGFFARHDLHIGAGGGAAWERCCIGAPTLALVCADNQAEVVAMLVREGAVATASSHDPAAIGGALSVLLGGAGARRRMHERGPELVDGRGAARVALALAAQGLAVRPAAPIDDRMAHVWRNDPRTRAVSSNAAPIEWSKHSRWWAQSLGDPQTALLVGRCGARDVGVLRFDFRSEGHARVAQTSIYLDPELTGLGLGGHLLAAGLRWLREHETGATTAEASVRTDNRASRTLFADAGFTQMSTGDWMLRLDAGTELTSQSP